MQLSGLVEESLFRYGLDQHLLKDPIVSNWINRFAFVVNWTYFLENRARQRRKIGKSFGNWEIIHHEALELCEKLQMPIFILFARDFSAKILIYYLVLGFELCLYHPSEYLMHFWYLSHLYQFMIETESKRIQYLSSQRKLKTKKKNLKSNEIVVRGQVEIDQVFHYFFSALHLVKSQIPFFFLFWLFLKSPACLLRHHTFESSRNPIFPWKSRIPI